MNGFAKDLLRSRGGKGGQPAPLSFLREDALTAYVPLTSWDALSLEKRLWVSRKPTPMTIQQIEKFIYVTTCYFPLSKYILKCIVF